LNDITHSTPAPRRRTSLQRIKRMLIFLLVVVLALWLLMCVGLYFKQDAMVFPRHMTTVLPGNRTRGLPPVEWLARTIDGGEVEAWFIPARQDVVGPAPLVVFFHGNAELIDDQWPVITMYHQRGYAMLLPEYRGYGESAGLPTEADIIDDAAWFIEQVLQRDDVDATSLVYHGRSLGGGVALGVMERRAPSAIICESTFVNVSSKAWRFGVPPLFVKHPFRSDRRIVSYAGPVLLFHGERDTIIPASESAALAKLHRAAQPDYETQFIELPGVGHNDAPGEHFDMQWREIDAFLQRHVGERAAETANIRVE
jgi:alpha-beta hydrolase superfamily lysophospholipase